MIKVNLIGKERKKAVKTSVKIGMPASVTPVVLLLIVAGSAFAGYWWYSDLTGQSANLGQQIQGLEARKAALEAVIKQDQIYETRKKILETRVKIVEGLQKNQVSPVLALDQLAEAVERTQYVWLSSLDQKDAVLSMNGTGTSLSAIADFYTNLNATGYFKNVDLGPSQETSGNFTFSLKCEFAPPRGGPVPNTVPNIPKPAAGGD
jgi:Tfp pilus assembly protein PilN